MTTLLLISAFAAAGIFFCSAAKRKKAAKMKEARRRALEDIDIANHMRVIDESIDLVNNSKNFETRISRLALCIDRLSGLHECYPHRQDIEKALKQCLQHRPRLHTEAVRSKAQKLFDKARLARTLTGKLNKATKALEVLKQAADDQYVDKTIITESANLLREFMHREELKEIETKAERFEFKENYKKALDLYQDALFFLKKDDIPDSHQTKDIDRIEEKIQTMKEFCTNKR